MNNKFSRIVCGFLSVVMCICSTVHMANISAEETDPNVHNANGVLDITTSEIRINGAEVTESTTVTDGSEVSLEFAWALSTAGYEAPVTFVYDLSSQLKNIVLDVGSLGQSNGTYYSVKDNKLYIEITTGDYGREGRCNLKGKVNLENAELNNDKTVTLQLIKEVDVLAPSKVAGVNAYKQAGAFSKADDGKFYQEFTITVSNYSQVAAKNVVLNDTFLSSTAGGIYVGDMIDFTINDNAYAGQVGHDISLGDIGKGESVNISYKVQVSPEAVLNGNNKENTIEIDYNDGTENKQITHTVSANPNLPNVSKSHSLNNDQSEITWTITVTPNMLDGLDGSSFFVLDTPDSKYADVEKISQQITGSSFDLVNKTVSIPFSSFVKTNDVYTVTYTTDVPASLKNTIFGTNIKNDVNATFTYNGAEYEKTVSDSVYIIGDTTNFISKTGERLNNGNIKWTFDVTIPDDEYISNLNLWDNASSANHKIDFSTMKVYDGNNEITGLIFTSSQTQITNEKVSQFDISFGQGTNALEKIKGKTLTFVCESVPDDQYKDDPNALFKNELSIWVNSTDYRQLYQKVEAIVGSDLIVSKDGEYQSGASGYAPIKWVIRAKSTGKSNFVENEKITIEDTIPDGHYLRENETTCWAFGYQLQVTTTPLENNMYKFEVTLTDDVATKLNTDFWNNLELTYYTYMTEEKYTEVVTGNGEVSVTNNAVVNVKSTDYNVSKTLDFTIPADKLLSKNAAIQSAPEDEYLKVKYTIDVNKDCIDLNPNGDKITVTDILGYYLELDETAEIGYWSQSNPGNASFSYEYSKDAVDAEYNGEKYGKKDTIEFTLDDKTSYQIWYTVKGKKLSMTNDISDEVKAELYNNTVTLSGISNGKVIKKLDSSSYTAQVDYVHSIKISGQKTWDFNTYNITAPATIEIYAEYEKFNILGISVEKGTFSEKATITINQDGTWTYVIDTLPYVDVNSNSYKYTIKEVLIDGYKVEYQENGLVNNSILDIDLKNTFTAHKEEIGALKVQKKWVHGANPSPATENVTVVLYEVNGGTKTQVGEKTITGNETVVFENLPLYHYTKNAQDDTTLDRTLRKYLVEEITSLTDYDTEYSIDSEFTLTNIKEAGTKVDSEDAITLVVTNTYKNIPDVDTGFVKVTKVWDDENDRDGSRPDTISVTLKSDDGYNKTKIIGDSNTDTFEDVPVYKENSSEKAKYTLTETDVTGYTTTYDVDVQNITLTTDTVTAVQITNTHIPQEYGSITVAKDWVNSTGLEYLQPDKIQVILTYNDGAADHELSIYYPDKSGFTNLPVYQTINGIVDTNKKVEYTITEKAVNGYTASYKVNSVDKVSPVTFTLDSAQTTVSITNECNYALEYGKISVDKTWLKADESSAGWVYDVEVTVTDSEGNTYGPKTITENTPALFENLPVKKYTRFADGTIQIKDIHYFVSESAVQDYETTYTVGGTAISGEGIVLTANTTTDVTVTNKQHDAQQEFGELTLTKVWDDDDATALRGDVVVTLTSDAGYSETKTIDISTTDSVTFDQLPVYDTENGGYIKYTVTEQVLDGYEVSYSDNIENGFTFDSLDTVSGTITNKLTFTEPLRSIEVTKKWLNKTGSPIDPQSDVLITLSATPSVISDKTFTIDDADPTQKATFNNLPVYEKYERVADGSIQGVGLITYTITEAAGSEYDVTISPSTVTLENVSENDSASVIITNKEKDQTIAPEIASITVNKVWNGGNVKPENITYKLIADGTTVDTKTVANNEVAKFENLPVKNANGASIKYEVVENAVTGYKTTYDFTEAFELQANVDKQVTVTNTFIDTTGALSVKKVWKKSATVIDDSITDTIQVVLLADGEDTGISATISPNQEKTFTNLPVYKYTAGSNDIVATPIKYSVKEVSYHEGYVTAYNGNNVTLEGGNKAITITNTKKESQSQPTESQSQPTESQSQPTESQSKPTESQSQPTESQSQPAESQSQPAESQSKPTQSESQPAESQSQPAQSESRPSVTTPSPVTSVPESATTTTVKNTTTVKAPDETDEDEEITTAEDDEELPEETTVDEDTDTTAPADPDDDLSEDETDIDDFTGSDSDVSTGIEENPNTSITINIGYVLAFAFGTYAFFPRKKKNK